MKVRHGAENEFLGKRDVAPGEHAVGDIGGQDSVGVRPDHRRLNGDEGVGKRVEVAARAAPGVGNIQLVPFAGPVAGGDLSLPVV